MNKKRILFFSIISAVLLVVIVLILILTRHNYAYTITMDINPSLEINLNKNKKIVRVKPLNKDAKDLIKNIDIKGKNFSEAVNVIRDEIVEKGYINSNDSVDIVIYSNLDDAINAVDDSFKEIDISPNIIVIDNITNHDKKLAKKYDVSPAKIVYLKELTKDNENIDIEDVVNNPIGSIIETIETGKTCPKGYFLEGDWCYKEIKRTKVKKDLVCPSMYKEYNGDCYKYADLIDTDEYECNDDETLDKDKCIRRNEALAHYDEFICEKGEKVSCGKVNGRDEEDTCFRCVDESKREYPTYICVKVIDGVCYGGAGKPHIDGKCLNGDIEYNGKCYEKRQYQYTCKDGRIVDFKDSFCPGDPAVTDPTPLYYCSEGETLVGSNCVSENIRDASIKRTCPTGYKLINNDMCLDLSLTTEKENGFVYDSEYSRIVNGECIIYDAVEAK